MHTHTHMQAHDTGRLATICVLGRAWLQGVRAPTGCSASGLFVRASEGGARLRPPRRPRPRHATCRRRMHDPPLARLVHRRRSLGSGERGGSKSASFCSVRVVVRPDRRWIVDAARLFPGGAHKCSIDRGARFDHLPHDKSDRFCWYGSRSRYVAPPRGLFVSLYCGFQLEGTLAYTTLGTAIREAPWCIWPPS